MIPENPQERRAGPGGRAALRGTALVLARAPSAQGEVKIGVIARLLHQIWRAVSDGILVLEDEQGELQVFFQRGVPVACASRDPARSLARWLIESGRMDEAAHQAAREEMQAGLSPGAALIAAGVLEPGEPLQAALRAHLKATLVKTVGAKGGRWRFHAGSEFATQIHAVEVLPLQVILEGARAGIPVKHFADALRAVVDAYPTRTGDFQGLLGPAGFTTPDLRLATALDGRSSTRTLLESHKAELKDVLSLVWFLSLIGAIAFHTAPDISTESPGKKAPLPPDRADAVRQAALEILPGSFFHAFGLDMAADAAAVERAYQAIAPRFRPEAFAEYDVGDLADLISAVQDRLTAAHRVLSNDEKRRSYLSFLLLGFELSGARRPGIDIDAEIAFKRGEHALRERRHAQAVSALREAVERNPREPEYAILLACAELFDPVLPIAARVTEARRLAGEALRLTADHPRAIAVLALAAKRAGDVAEARRVVLAGLKVHPYSELLKRASMLVAG